MARTISANIIIGRRRIRSAQTPANKPTNNHGMYWVVPSVPIWIGVASSVVAATIGRARRVT